MAVVVWPWEGGGVGDGYPLLQCKSYPTIIASILPQVTITITITIATITVTIITILRTRTITITSCSFKGVTTAVVQTIISIVRAGT